MLLKTHQASLALQTHQVISLCDAAGTAIRVTQGTLWITQENDPRDHILRAGDQMFLSSAGHTVLSAINGRAMFVATERNRPRRRNYLANLLRGIRPPLRMTRHPIAVLHGATFTGNREICT